ncbi:hypothetical protein [Micromonospora sp. NBC_01638]|uniref:hypothetical protein n=1 Tax=Micromonospora sp. NBC_01638 TaxID=2975982 RepID=UPI0038672CC8|nr:hypothetical protein OG811_11305 [Micromonospora sp. NBC_01638]
MTEPEKTVAQQTEDRLESLAETVREKFNKVTKGTYRDRVVEGRFAEQGDKGGDKGPAKIERQQD